MTDKEGKSNIFGGNSYAAGSGGSLITGSALYDGSYTRNDFIQMATTFLETDYAKNNLTSEQKERYKSCFIDHAGEFFDIVTQQIPYGYSQPVDPRFIFCIGVHESGFGTSRICKDKLNFWGWGAVDGNAYESALTFSSIAEGIERVSGDLAHKWISDDGSSDWSQKQMIVENGYQPDTIQGIGSICASDGSWAKLVISHMERIFGYKSGGAVIDKAAECMKKIQDWGFVYSQAVSRELPVTQDRGGIDCSIYVSWVMYELGLQEKCYTSATYRSNPQGWQKITDKDNLQPGDILVYIGHVEIYAGPGKDGTNNTTIFKYTAGSTNSIQKSPVTWPYESNYQFALRPPI